MSEELVLSGLDGSNPLGFLAAVGSLRLLSATGKARMHWRKETAAWRPVLTDWGGTGAEALVERLLQAPGFPVDVARILGKNLTVAPAVFQNFVAEAEGQVKASGDLRAADFATAFGSEVCVDRKKGDRVEYTNLCFITGSGHQDFVETAKALVREVQANHLREALFGPWLTQDKGLSFRWDPTDAAEYALRWDNPGPLGVKSVWGANRLAVEALPLFAVQPTGKGLATTGFREQRYPEEFSWPIWTSPVSCDTVRSLLALEALTEDRPPRDQMSAMGVAEVFRSPRVRIGQGANFKVSFRPAKSV